MIMARVLAQTGEEHLHLHLRGVLRLVQDDGGVWTGWRPRMKASGANL